ncbi:hypothetical protein [Enterococcus olivae]
MKGRNDGERKHIKFVEQVIFTSKEYRAMKKEFDAMKKEVAYLKKKFEAMENEKDIDALGDLEAQQEAERDAAWRDWLDSEEWRG